MRIKLQNIIMLTIAGFVNAFGVTVFLSPVKLYDSGISGTSMLLSQITPQWGSLSFFLLLFPVYNSYVFFRSVADNRYFAY